MRRYGLEPLKQLLQEKRINGFWAEKFHERLLKKRALQDWIHWTKSNQIMRRVKAEEFEKQKLLTTSFSKWMEVIVICSFSLSVCLIGLSIEKLHFIAPT